jgi:ketosteroid isomerase-like protein
MVEAPEAVLAAYLEFRDRIAGADDGGALTFAAMKTPSAIETWHRIVRDRDTALLQEVLAEDAVFHSPVVHSPQRGRALVAGYLGAALRLLSAPGFRYVREIVGEHDAMLEFEVDLDGIQVDGVDIIRWNAAGQIVDFKVMIRPLKAINLVAPAHGRIAGRGAAALGPRSDPAPPASRLH